MRLSHSKLPAKRWTELTVDLPHDPSGQPTLVHETTSERIELYSPDLSRVAPRYEVDDTTIVEPVVFLYKIEAPSHNVSFIWRVSVKLYTLNYYAYHC